MFTTELFLIFLVLLFVVVSVYQKSTNAIYKESRKLNGKTAVVTGGTAGMGLEIAKDLANRGAKVIICCPFDEEGAKALEEIIKETSNDKVYYQHLDLASLASVREFANDILKNEDRLDILVNNAGVSIPNDSKTKDGLNFIMQVNYFGHFLLTILLVPLLKKSTPSRIISTSSVTHRFIKMNIKTLNTVSSNFIMRHFVYVKSKYLMMPFSLMLKKKLENTGVTTNIVDPGAVGTRIYDNCDYYGTLFRLLCHFCFKTVKEGAQTAIYAAVDESLEGVSGKYLKNCAVSAPARGAFNERFADKVWEESVRLVKVTDEDLKNSFG